MLPPSFLVSQLEHLAWCQYLCQLTGRTQVRLCAKWRLLFQVPEGFRFIVCKVDELGGLTMQDVTNTPWDITFDQFIARLSFYSTPAFGPMDESVMARMLKRLDFLDSPEHISARAKKLKEELESEYRHNQKAGGKHEQAMWLYCLEEAKDPKHAHPQATALGETTKTGRVWAPLTSRKDFKAVIQTVEESKVPLAVVVILVSIPFNPSASLHLIPASTCKCTFHKYDGLI